MTGCFLNGCWVGAKTNLDEFVMEVILLVIYRYVYGVYLQQHFVLVYIRGCVVQHRQLHALIHEELGVHIHIYSFNCARHAIKA